jgi:hypothetical protein
MYSNIYMTSNIFFVKFHNFYLKVFFDVNTEPKEDWESKLKILCVWNYVINIFDTIHY